MKRRLFLGMVMIGTAMIFAGCNDNHSIQGQGGRKGLKYKDDTPAPKVPDKNMLDYMMKKK